MLNVARMLLKVPLHLCFSEFKTVNIDGVAFKLMVREDAMGQIRFGTGNPNSLSSDSNSSNSVGSSCYVNLDEDKEFRTVF